MSVNPSPIAGRPARPYEEGMNALPHALFRASDTLTTPLGAFLVQQAGAEDASALRRALAGGLTGVALAGCRRGADVQRLAVLLSVAEAEEDRPEGSCPILAVTDGILPAPAGAEGFAGSSARLAGLVWDHAALARTLGAEDCRAADGAWTAPFAAARAAVLLSARAADLRAYDSACPLAGENFVEDCRRSRADGFFGRLAQVPEQIPVIESIYGGR